MKVLHEEKSAQRIANQAISENVNEKSDAFLASQFYDDFCSVIQNQLE